MEEIKAGDVVQLKSGGPRMTVEVIEEDDGVVLVSVAWFTEKWRPQRMALPQCALKRAEP